MTIHEWPNMTSGEAYDKTQYDDNVNAGDIIVLDKIVGFLYSAWPTAVRASRPKWPSNFSLPSTPPRPRAWAWA